MRGRLLPLNESTWMCESFSSSTHTSPFGLDQASYWLYAAISVPASLRARVEGPVITRVLVVAHRCVSGRSADLPLGGIAPVRGCLATNGRTHRIKLNGHVLVFAHPVFNRERRRASQITSTGLLSPFYDFAPRLNTSTPSQCEEADDECELESLRASESTCLARHGCPPLP